MTAANVRKIETRFARRGAMDGGIGLEDAVAAADARLEAMRVDATAKIDAMLCDLQARRPALAGGDPEAFGYVRARADGLAGLASMFAMPEVAQAAVSLCRLFDATAPARPTADAVGVHLDAFLMFRALRPAEIAASATEVLQGLDKVVATARGG